MYSAFGIFCIIVSRVNVSLRHPWKTKFRGNLIDDVFIKGEDLIIKLTGVDGNSLSWNSDFATVALV